MQLAVNQDPWNADTGSVNENACERFFWVAQGANYNVLGVIAATSGGGRLVERYEYSPYGQRTVYSHGWSPFDFDDSGVIDQTDKDALTAKMFVTDEPASVFDINGDGIIDTTDLAIFNAKWATAPYVGSPNDPLVSYPRLTSFQAELYGPVLSQPLNPVGHQGLMHDEAMGLIHNRARMLHPRLGRFTQRDPLGYVDGMSVYQYVNLDPVSQRDPTGLTSKEDIPDQLIYSCNCGWIDWKHASKGTASSIWNQVTGQSGQKSLNGKRFKVTTSIKMSRKIPDLNLTFTLSSGQSMEYFAEYTGSRQRQEQIALGIFKAWTLAFESWQGNFSSRNLKFGENLIARNPIEYAALSAIQAKVNKSSFSEEDLVSNLISFYRNAKGYSRTDIEKFCGVLTPNQSRAVWDETGGLGKNNKWTPVYHNNDSRTVRICCGVWHEPRLPDELDSIEDASYADGWRAWYRGGPYKDQDGPIVGIDSIKDHLIIH